MDIFEKQGGFLWTDEEVPLPLQLRYRPLVSEKKKDEVGDNIRPVLILHGASVGADTFLAPGHGGGCLVDYLLRENYEPCLLDWRANKEVAATIVRLREGEAFDLGLPPELSADIKKLYAQDNGEVFEQLNFNSAVQYDIRRALEAIAFLRPGQPIDVIAHCMGGAAMAEALLSGALVDDKDPGVGKHLSHVVLSTIGAFYQMILHGRLKSESQLLGVLQAANRHFVGPRPAAAKQVAEGGLDPKPPLRDLWPDDVETLYRAWRLPYDERLLMVRSGGQIEARKALFADGHLIGQVIEVDVGEEPLLPELFGDMSVDLFQHGAENLHAGMATELGEGGSVSRLEKLDKDGADAYEYFNALDHLTLISGGLNRLWHRDGIDRMADWLSRSPDMRGRYRKEALLDYGHQDLYWGRNAPEDVFPKSIAGLGPTPPTDRKGALKAIQATEALLEGRTPGGRAWLLQEGMKRDFGERRVALEHGVPGRPSGFFDQGEAFECRLKRSRPIAEPLPARRTVTS